MPSFLSVVLLGLGEVGEYYRAELSES